MKLRLEIDVDAESLVDDGTLPSRYSTFDLNSEVAEVRKEILEQLKEIGGWTVIRGGIGIYFLERGEGKSEEPVGFNVKETK